MSNHKSEDPIASSKYTAKSETERLFSVFDNFYKDAEETKNLSLKDTTSDRQAILTMSSIGQLGRFGNQLFQYAFLLMSLGLDDRPAGAFLDPTKENFY